MLSYVYGLNLNRNINYKDFTIIMDASEFENKVTQGRFLLEKKTKVNLAQPGVKVVSCEFSPSVT
jgi:hypothetical protein